MRSRLNRYIVTEILGPLGLGFLVYTFILLIRFLFQSAEMIIRRGLPVSVVGKLLLLTHAFEKLDCIAVEFRTHFFNHQSRRGIERLGAKLDGILRNHQIAPNGTLRDTVVYSILVSESPTAKAHLNYQLNEKAR